jgi:AraC-like DNA-binding protein
MPLLEQPARCDETDQGFVTPQGLFRRESLASGPAGTIANLFTNLRQVCRGEIIAEHPERHLQGTRLAIERSAGQGSWEFYRLDQDLYLVAANGIYESTRIETVPGEGLVEFHLRLNGSLQMQLPHDGTVVNLRSPGLLILYQPPGVDLKVRVDSKVRETGVSLYCHPRWLRELACRSGIACWHLLEEIERHPQTVPWFRQLDLTPALQYIANSLLNNHHRSGIRLLHAEAKSLELLCELLSGAQAQIYPQPELVTAGEARQLDAARRLLASNLKAPVRVREVARAVGMSESKLRRLFKAHVGVTVSDFALECRMRCALDLLRGKQVSVGEAARAVGYRHQTSFASAFQDFFGFQPRKARQDMH